MTKKASSFDVFEDDASTSVEREEEDGGKDKILEDLLFSPSVMKRNSSATTGRRRPLLRLNDEEDGVECHDAETRSFGTNT